MVIHFFPQYQANLITSYKVCYLVVHIRFYECLAGAAIAAFATGPVIDLPAAVESKAPGAFTEVYGRSHTSNHINLQSSLCRIYRHFLSLNLHEQL